MATIVGHLKALLSLDSASYSQGMRRAREDAKRTKKGLDHFSKGLKGVGGAMSSTQAKIAGLVGAAGFGALIARSAQTQDALAKTADKLGVTTRSLGGLQYAVGQTADVADGALAEALTKASKRLGEFNATGGGASAKWLEKLNLDTRELAALSPDQLFMRYSESIRGLNDRGQQMAAISALMGDEARGLINTIDAGPEAIRAMSQEAEALGVAMSRADLAKVEASNDAIARSMTVVEGVANRVTVALAPYIEALSNTFADAAVEHRGFENQIVSGSATVIRFGAKVADIWQGLQVVFQGIEVIFWGVVSAVTTGADELMAPFRALIEQANKIPGVNIEISDSISAVAETTRQKLIAATDELHNMAMEPMPSAGVEAFLENIKTAADEAGQAVAAARAGKTGGGETGSMPGFEDGAADRIAKLQESLMGEREVMRTHYEERALIVEDAFQQSLVGESERKALLEQLERDHLQRVYSMNLQSYQDQAKLDESLWQTKTRSAIGGMVQLTQGVAQHSKAMFELNKRAAIADALVNAPAAASGAYRFGANIGGPVLGAAFAATALYAQQQKIQAIRSTSFQGGGGGTTPSAAGTAATINDQAVPQPIPQQGQDRESAPVVNINISGDSYGTEELQDKIVEAYRDAIERDRL